MSISVVPLILAHSSLLGSAGGANEDDSKYCLSTLINFLWEKGRDNC
jgi:hypothetical protein